MSSAVKEPRVSKEVDPCSDTNPIVLPKDLDETARLFVDRMRTVGFAEAEVMKALALWHSQR